MTLGEFRRLTKDMSDDAQIVMRYKDWSDGGKLFIYNLRVENHPPYDWRSKGEVIIDEI